MAEQVHAHAQTRGGRRRRRGGQQRQNDSHQPNHGTGNVPTRGRLRDTGRGGQGGGHHGRQVPAQQKDDDTTTSETTVKPAAEENVDDGEICFICASEVEHISVSPCNHRSCHICSLRLRALYKNKACAHCRVCTSFPSFGYFLILWMQVNPFFCSPPCRRNQHSSSSRTIQSNDSRPSRKRTLRKKTKTWV